MYKITADSANHRVEVVFDGSYLDLDQPQLSRDLRAGVLEAKGRGAHFDMLCDFTRVAVMPQDRTPGARAEIEWCVANGLRKSANVVSSALAKMQLQRLSADDRFQNFATRAEALAWLEATD